MYWEGQGKVVHRLNMGIAGVGTWFTSVVTAYTDGLAGDSSV